ncbi:MAG: tRNA pseudouridine(55) synthase TruB [Deltaproteobacteria bacterium]|nr:tRNA pseudouridine(55) synthase TruB [Deltaproteobacteria bacterium]MBZ0218825.1 tRNA pseudouridine(55) synthase TruB [Deltaproteobacteria bacterium]
MLSAGYNGVLVIDKPQGWTSHDVVQHVKRKLKARKVGHLGTLDPIATGVLVLVLDSATKYAASLGAGSKEYLAACKLGEETDTYDSEGSVVRAPGVAGLTGEEIKKAIGGFRGRISQVPPMYSAIKSKGTPLYKLARKGVTVEREAREVTVHELEVTALDLPVLEFRAVCSGGTYVRSICHDLGERLGCGAHLQALRRTRSGAFRIDEAAHPKIAAEELAKRIIPLDEALKRAEAEAGPHGPEV